MKLLFSALTKFLMGLLLVGAMLFGPAGGFDYVNGIPQYISAGLGASAYYPWQPFRLFNQPEIAYVTLTARMK